MIKLTIIGARGLPAKYGGFETFVEKLAIGLSNDNYRIKVICDKDHEITTTYKNIILKSSAFAKSKNPILFYLDSIIRSLKDSDIILSCGSGGGYFALLPRLFGIKFVTNPDGLGYKRDKWSSHIKIALKSLFYSTAKFSEYLVYDSFGIRDLFQKEFKRSKKSVVIEYGSEINSNIIKKSQIFIKSKKLKKHDYHLVVSRLEPENNVDTIIKGYIKSKQIKPLVIVGNIQSTKYVDELLNISYSQNIIFLGGVYNKEHLQELRYNTFSYWHGHSVGGTNPSLLEAMGSKNLCICHDNIFNREVTENNSKFFTDQVDVKNIFLEIEDKEFDEFQTLREAVYSRVVDYYNWNSIINKYNVFFKDIVRRN